MRLMSRLEYIHSTRNPTKPAAVGGVRPFVGFQSCIISVWEHDGTNLRTTVLVLIGFAEVHTAGSITQISGCHDPFETESSRTKNIFSRRMNPSPIFHFLGVDSPMIYGSCYGSVLSNARNARVLSWRTYSHRVQVGLELSRNQVCESAAFYWVALFVIAGCGDLISQSMSGNQSWGKHSYLV